MYYFIGIKGAGMSALACVLYDLGYEVCGSDKPGDFFTTDGLKARNIKVLDFNKDNIKEDMIIIKGSSFDETNEEVLEAERLGLKIYTYPEMVSKLTKMFQTITVAGCHGKKVTASMLAHVLSNLRGVNYLIGDGTGHASKENKWFILEACEYKRHFLEYEPYYAIITNIDYDHADYFEDINDVVNAYEEYANKAEKMVIACGDDPYTHSLEVNPPVFYYGTDDDNDVIAKNVQYDTDGTSFDVFVEDNYYGHFDLPVYGKAGLLNALAVISFCYYERYEAKEVSKFLKTFEGAKRRFKETIINSNVLIDDYAHHPAEMRATIKAVYQKYPDKDLVVIFEPHTYSRLKAFIDDYVEILKNIKHVYIMDVYDARGEEAEVTSDDLIKRLDNAEKISKNDMKKLLNYDNSVLIFMSPNDIRNLEKEYIKIKES